MSRQRAGHSTSDTRNTGGGAPTAARLGLLAASSIFPLLAAPAANAQCTAVDGAGQPVSLGALTTNSVVSCTGTAANQALAHVPGAQNITVNVDGSSSLPGFVTAFSAPNTQINVVGGATIDNSALGGSGDGTFVALWGANGSNVSLGVGGTGSTILHFGGSLTTSQVLLSGQNSSFESGSGSSISGAGPANGNGVLAGEAGDNIYRLGGALNARSDGLLITDTGGDDTYFINSGATFGVAGGGRGRILDQDGLNDLLLISGTHNLNLDITGVDRLTYAGLTGDSLTFNGVGDLKRLRVNGGAIGQIDIGSMMAADGLIDVRAGASARYSRSLGAPLFSQSLIGGGEFELDGQSTLVAGDNSGFSGTLRLTAATFFGTNQNAAGTANIIIGNNLLLGSVNLSNQISGQGTLIMQGTGVGSLSVLSGVNTYTGGTQVANAGSRLLLTNANAAGTGQVQIGGDAFLELDFGAAGGDFTNLVTGGGTLKKTGAGELTLSNTANNHAGGTVIDGGVLRVTDLAALGSGGVVANTGGALMYDYSGASSKLLTTPLLTGGGQFIKAGSGTLVISNANTWTGGAQILAGRVGLNNGQGLGTGTINIAQGGVLGIGGVTLANDVTGAGQIIKTANNIAILSGVNTSTGGIVVQQGAIQVSSGASLGAGPVDIHSGASLLLEAAGDSSVGAQLQGAGSVVKNGAGRVELTGSNALAGAVVVQQGTLAVGSSSNIGAASLQLDAAGTLEISRASGDASFDNNISGAGRLVKTGAASVTINGANTYSGGTHIQGGALRVTDLSRLGSGGVIVDAGAALDLNISANALFNQAVSGAGNLRKSGSGSLTLLSNTLSGGLDVTQGDVTVETISALGAGPVSMAQGATLTVNNAANETSSVLFSGGGQFIKNGQGDLIIQNANTYTGGTTINAGRIGLNNGAGLGSGAVTINANATLSLGGVTVGNDISGAGVVLKTAANTGVLAGTNTHTGGTIVQQGTLRVAGAQSLGGGSVTIDAGAALDVTGAGNTTLGNLLQGGGGLVKAGSGALTLNTANTFAGGTTINGGAIALTHALGLGSGSVSISSGAALNIGDIVFANQISGAGSVTKTGSGSGQLTGANTHSGGVTVTSGTLRATGVAPLGTGALTVASGATFQIDNAASLTFANGLSGAGTFRKTGAGDLTFSNPFSIGSLAVDAGRVRLGAAMTGNAAVASGARLDGTGRVIGALSNAGVVAPGNSIGTLTVQGNYTHQSTGLLEIEFDGSGNIDLLDVTGAVQINGGTLRFIGLGGAEGSGGTFLRAGGGLTGTFATVETVGSQLPLAVIYSANAGSMSPSVLTARPSTFNSQLLAGADQALAFSNSVTDVGLLDGEPRGVWAQGFATNAERDAGPTTLGYEHEASGFAGGGSIAFGPRWSVGGALGWSSADISLDSNGGGGQQDALMGSAYLRFEQPGFVAVGGVMAGKLEQSTTRRVTFNTLDETVSGDTESLLTGAFLAGSLDLARFNDWTLAASGRISHLIQQQDGYTESGSSPLRLTLTDLTARTNAARIGLDLIGSFDAGQTEIVPAVSVGLNAMSAVDDRLIPVTFAVSSASVALDGDTDEHTSAYARAGLTWRFSDGASLDAGYEGQFGDHLSHQVQIRWRKSF